jgi:hypothetical protein
VIHHARVSGAQRRSNRKVGTMTLACCFGNDQGGSPVDGATALVRQPGQMIEQGMALAPPVFPHADVMMPHRIETDRVHAVKPLPTSLRL